MEFVTHVKELIDLIESYNPKGFEEFQSLQKEVMNEYKSVVRIENCRYSKFIVIGDKKTYCTVFYNLQNIYWRSFMNACESIILTRKIYRLDDRLEPYYPCAPRYFDEFNIGPGLLY